MNKGAANNIIEKLADTIAWECGLTQRADDVAHNAARAVLQTLHDNITPEMIAGAESAAWDHGNHMPMPRYAECAIKGALATALKGERA